MFYRLYTIKLYICSNYNVHDTIDAIVGIQSAINVEKFSRFLKFIM